MRRALTLSTAAVTAAVGVLLPAGSAAAEPVLVPGQTQVLSVALAPGDWNDRLPTEVTVQVTHLVQHENGCLEPERDTTCEDDEGELAAQLRTTVTAGVSDAGGVCQPRGLPAVLDLTRIDVPVKLAMPSRQSWAPVDCLHLELTFMDLPENNVAQSDSVSFDLRTSVWGLDNEMDDDEEPVDTEPGPSDGSSAGTGGSSTGPGGTLGTGGTVGPAGGADQGATGPDGAAAPGAAGAGQPGAGLPDGAPVPAAPAAGGGQGELLAQTDASVTIGSDGATAALRTQAADSSFVAQALVWGGAFLGALALGWMLFLLVRRRRRAEHAA